MGMEYSFVDGKVYGTDDINNITRCLTGAGVSPFVSKDSYAVSDINALTEAVVEGGTTLDGCVCSAETADGEVVVTVGQGIVFFESGQRMVVDEEGYEISVPFNSSGYVFAHYSPSLQRAELRFDAELPTDGEYVVLAGLSESGDLSDKRVFARSRVATFGCNAVKSIEEERITIYEEGAAPVYDTSEYIIAEIDLSGIDITKFNYLIYRYSAYVGHSTDNSYCEKFFDFKNNQRASFYIKGSLYYHSGLFDIVLEGTKFVVICGRAQHGVFSYYQRAFRSAIPYLTLV